MKKYIKKIFFSVLFTTLVVCGIAFSEYFPDVIVTSPTGVWTDTRAYTTINAAVTAVGSNVQDIYVIRKEVTAALTINANTRLHFFATGSIANTGQLTINTTNILAGNFQIFTGVGNIDFAPGSVVKTGWFSNIESAFALTNNDTVTLIVSKSQTITASYSPGNNVTLKWESPGNILTVNAGVVVGNINNIEAGKYQLFAGAGDFDFVAGSEIDVSWFASFRYAVNFTVDDGVNLTLFVSRPSAVDFSIATLPHQKLKINQGALLTINTGITFTIGGPLEIGIYQAFNCAGTGKIILTSGLYDAASFGIIPDDATAATYNTKMLRMLVSPLANGGMADGIPMKVTFRNKGTYYFNNYIPLRYDIHLDLMDSTLRLDYKPVVGDYNAGFLYGLSDISIQNGTIHALYDETNAISGANAAVMMGSRNDGAATFTYFPRSYDDELARPLGNITLRNLTVQAESTTAGTGTVGMKFIGGLRNVVVENIIIDGKDSATRGFDYEFGQASDPYTVARIANPHLVLTSHAFNMKFKNIIVQNVVTNAAFGIRGAFNVEVDGLYTVDGIVSAIAAGVGEAANYNPGAEYLYGVKRNMTFKNIVAKTSSSGIVLSGLSAGGYLNTAPATELDEIYQADLCDYVLDGFTLTGEGVEFGIAADGNYVIKNGHIEGYERGMHNGVVGIMQNAIIENVNIFDCSAIGIYFYASTSVYAVTQWQTGSIRHCFMANIGTAGVGYGILAANLRNFIIEGNKFGGDKWGGSTEVNMSNAVQIDGANCYNVMVRNNNVVDIAAGAYAYREHTAATYPSNHLMLNSSTGDITRLGSWIIDGIPRQTATELATAAGGINTINKYIGKQVYCSSYDQIFVAIGAGATDKWRGTNATGVFTEITPS